MHFSVLAEALRMRKLDGRGGGRRGEGRFGGEGEERPESMERREGRGEGGKLCVLIFNFSYTFSLL